MADMYSIVKKQDEKIDDLLKIAKENKDLLIGIDTRIVSASGQTSATTTPSVSEKIQVELPGNVATNESVKTVVEAALKQQKTDSLKSLDFSQFPEKLAEAFKNGLDKNVTKALHVGIRNEFTSQINGLNESAKKLTDRMYNIVNGAIGLQSLHGYMPSPELLFLSLSDLVSGATISTKRTSISRR